MFAAILEFIASPCMHFCKPGTSKWSLGLSDLPMHDIVLPAGNFGFPAMSSSHLHRYVSVLMFDMPGLCLCPSNSSGCCIALPVGRSGSIRSNWCMLTISWATAPMHHIPIGRMYSRGSCISIQTRRRLHHLLL